jgi:anaerobic selenocysteine-containing dehydrogenase
MRAMERHFRTCSLCEAMCGMVITVDGGAVVDVRGDDDDPFSRGHICPKGPAMRDLVEDPDRLRGPVARRDGRFVPIGWDEAFALAATRLRAIADVHGKDAVGIYLGNPSAHNHGAILMGQGFLGALGTRNRFDANSQDANPRLYACAEMYGAPFAIPIPDIDRTDYFLMLGANPAASNGSVMTLGDVRGRFQALRKRGAKLVVIDPRRTETAVAWADEHHFIRPGGDAALLLAMLQVIFAEGLEDRDALAAGADGVEELRALAGRYPPERVAARTGIAAATIRRLARELAGAERAVAYGRVGTCQNELGSVASWLIDALCVVTGNFDRPGGIMFPEPAADITGLARKLGVTGHHRWRSRVRGAPEIGGQLPAACIAEEIETPGEGQIRGFVTVAGNPVLSAPNGERIAAALARLEFMVSIDMYVNETTRHAHLILPPVPALQRSHYDLVFNLLAVRNVAKYSQPVLPRDPEGKEDWEILYELGMRLGGMRLGGMRLGGRALDAGLRLAWRAGVRIAPDRVVDALLRLGPWQLSLRKLRRAPHGVDLGPLRPCRAKRLATPGARVRLAPPALVADAARVDAWLGRTADGLVLIGRRHLRSNNSWMHNVHALVKGPDRAALFVHPDDAAHLGVTAGDEVRVTSRVGSVTARAEVTDDVMPGVVSLPHGFGHQGMKPTLKVAGDVAGPNLNALTDDMLLDPPSGTAVLNGVPVTVEAQAGAAAGGRATGSSWRSS